MLKRLSLNLPEGVLKALDRHVQKRNEASVAMVLSRSDAIREALVEHLRRHGEAIVGASSAQPQGASAVLVQVAGAPAYTGPIKVACPACKAKNWPDRTLCVECDAPIGPEPACGNRELHEAEVEEHEICRACDVALHAKK